MKKPMKILDARWRRLNKIKRNKRDQNTIIMLKISMLPVTRNWSKRSIFSLKRKSRQS